MKKHINSKMIANPTLLGISLVVALGLSVAVSIPPANAHTGCKEDIEDLEQTILGLESMLKVEERRHPHGSTQKRIHRSHERKLKKMLQANRDHIKEANAAGCPEFSDPLEERVKFLEHKLEHLSK